MECLELNYKVPAKKKRIRTKFVVRFEEISNELLTQDLWRYDVKNSDFAYRHQNGNFETKLAYRHQNGVFETKVPEELPI